MLTGAVDSAGFFMKVWPAVIGIALYGLSGAIHCIREYMTSKRLILTDSLPRLLPHWAAVHAYLDHWDDLWVGFLGCSRFVPKPCSTGFMLGLIMRIVVSHSPYSLGVYIIEDLVRTFVSFFFNH